MSKNDRKQQTGSASQRGSAPKSYHNTSAQGHAASSQQKAKRAMRLPILPMPVVALVLVWMWAALWQGDVFRIIRENSFFAFDQTLMQFELDKPNGMLWTTGRGLLMTFRLPWLGGLLLAFLLTASCWMLGYVLRLKGSMRWLQYLPILLFTGIFTYQGLSNWFEAESGHVMGYPLLVFVCLCVLTLITRIALRKPMPSLVRKPKNETPRQNRLQLYAIVLSLAIPMVYGAMQRPYVRPLAQMQVGVSQQDWQRVIDVAHANDEISNRPMAAQYAIALVQTNQVGEHMFDIRLDYDSVYVHSINGGTNPTNMYLMECDYHAGLVETAYHHAMESMAIEGPTLRNLKMLCKTSLLRNEWEVASKYIDILDRVPFEGDFVNYYRPMLRDSNRVNSDPEFITIRLLEPFHDVFENTLVQPTFLGYNASLTEGRSTNALINAIMVTIYTKSMPALMARIQPLIGTTPPASIMEAITLMSGKTPALKQAFPSIDMNLPRLQNFLSDTQQYVGSPEERAAHARELFPKYKGYYPYYYFFGNLKATRKQPKQEKSAGVN